MHRNDFEDESWKLRMSNIWKDGLRRKEMETTHEILRMGEKNSHNQIQLWEDGNKLESWILKRMEQDWEKNLPRSSNPKMTTRNTTMNCWDTPGRKLERLNQRWKEIPKILEKDIWLMIIHSYVKLGEEFESSSGKIEGLGKILGKDLWVRAH